MHFMLWDMKRSKIFRIWYGFLCYYSYIIHILYRIFTTVFCVQVCLILHQENNMYNRSCTPLFCWFSVSLKADNLPYRGMLYKIKYFFPQSNQPIKLHVTSETKLFAIETPKIFPWRRTFELWPKVMYLIWKTQI